MAAHPKRKARILPAGFSIFQGYSEYIRLKSGRQISGKTRNELLQGMRYHALIIAIILVAGLLPVVSGTKDHQINAGAGYGGSIQPSGLVTVQSGDTPLFSIIPAQGFRISSVVIDGSPVGAVPVYTFAPVRDDHMIFARFVRMTGSLYLTSDPAGARVYLDDQFADTIPDQGGLAIGNVAVGPHTLRFVLAGYQTVQIDVTVEEGEQTVVPLVVLTPPEPPVTTAPPTTVPTTVPTTAPTTTATTVMTSIPTTFVTTVPTTAPTTTPTPIPTTAPITASTTFVTTVPTTAMTTPPTTVPTTAPTPVPTTAVTTPPTTVPTTVPTTAATSAPTTNPTTVPTTVPTTAPTTLPTTVPEPTQTANPTPTPTPEPSPSSAGTGGVFVVSDPTATVLIQGKEWGRSNEVIENVPTGMQTITLSRQGYVSQNLVVNIGMGRVSVTPGVTLELLGDAAETQTPTAVTTPGPDSRYPANGALFIYTVPFGCSLSIDEISGGITPKLITSVPPGAHTVNISLPGYRSSSRTVTVHPGDVSVVLVMMTPDFGSIGSAFS